MYGNKNVTLFYAKLSSMCDVLMGFWLWFQSKAGVLSAYKSDLTLNSLRAKFFRGNINIYLHFMSLLHIDMAQVLKILHHVRPGLTYAT